MIAVFFYDVLTVLKTNTESVTNGVTIERARSEIGIPFFSLSLSHCKMASVPFKVKVGLVYLKGFVIYYKEFHLV